MVVDATCEDKADVGMRTWGGARDEKYSGSMWNTGGSLYVQLPNTTFTKHVAKAMEL